MRRRLLGLAAVLAAATAVALLVSGGDDGEGPRSPRATATAPAALAPGPRAPAATAPALPCAAPAGERLTYRLRLRAVTRRADVGAASLVADGGVDLAGRLEVTDLGPATSPAASERLVSYRLLALDRADARLLGRPLPLDALVGATAVARVGRCGALEAVAFAADTPELARHMLAGLVAELTIPRAPDAAGPPADAWETPWATMLADGAATARLAATPEGARLTLGRTRVEALRFATVGEGAAVYADGRWNATFDAEGRLVALSGSETVVATDAGREAAHGRSQLRLDLTARGPAPAVAGPPAALEAYAAAEPAPSAARRALDARVAGMTAESLVEDVITKGLSGRLPDHAQWLWQATGLLERDPEVARALLALFEDPDLTDPARALVLDLLANVGHAEAQAALREALTSPTLRRSEAGAQLAQRLMLLRRPEVATARALAAEYAAAGEDEAWALPLAMGLGALAGRLGDEVEAETLTRPLLAELARPDLSDGVRATLVDALGNARLSAHLPTLEGLSGHPDVATRVAVARALRGIADPAAADALLGLLGDAHDAVQRAALRALGDGAGRGAEVDAAVVAAVVSAVDAGAVSRESLGAAVGLAARWADRGVDVTALLSAIIGATDASARQRAAALTLRGALVARQGW